MRIAILALALLALASSCKKPAASAPADAGGESLGPTITVRGSEVRVQGELSGTTRPIEELGRLQKIDALFDRLKRDREIFKASHPDDVFPGEATISVEPATRAIVFKSVFQTAAYAGYPFLSTDIGDLEPVRLSAVIPGPHGEALPARARLHVRLSSDRGVELDEERDNAIVSTRSIAQLDDADLQNRVKSAIVDQLLRGDFRANVVEIVLHSENALPFSSLSPVLRGLRDAHTRLAGPNNPDGAFLLRFAVN